ncbi:MAG: glycosyltransferase [Gammaproteobacteria bacterium]
MRAALKDSNADILFLDSVEKPAAIFLATVALPARVIVSLSFLESARCPSVPARLFYRSARVATLLCDVAPENAGDTLSAKWLGRKVSILPHGFSADWYETGVDLKQFGVPEGAFTIASVAERHARANLEWLIESAHWIPMDLPVHFLLVAPAATHERLRRLIRKMPFTQRFHLCDRVDEAPGLLASANVTVISDWNSEVQRRGCLQSLAVGVPVFAPDKRAIRRIVRPGVNGALIADKDPELLAHELYELYEDHGRRESLSAGAKRSVRNWPSMPQYLLQLRALLEKSLAD